MPTVSVQPAIPAASSLPAASPAPSGDGAFAVTLGRAMSSLPGGSSAAPGSSKPAGRAKEDATATALAGTFFNCMFTTLTQPAQGVVPVVGGQGGVAASSPVAAEGGSGSFSFEGEGGIGSSNLTSLGAGEKLSAPGVTLTGLAGAGTSFAGAGRFSSRWGGHAQGTLAVTWETERPSMPSATGAGQVFAGAPWGAGSNLSFNSSAASRLGETAPGGTTELAAPSGARSLGDGAALPSDGPSGTAFTSW